MIGTLAGLLAGCTPPPPKPIDPATFDGRRAMAHVETMVRIGPRPAGSPLLTKTATYISSQLEEAGLTAHEQVFTSPSPRGPLQFRNVVAKTSRPQGSTGQVIIVASHFDTKYLPDINFVGANDGASSSGALLEIARCATSQPDIWFVFFDGEEAIREYDTNDGLVGSKFFVEQLKGDDQVKWIKAVIVLDMIGDANLKITLPANSSGPLVQQTFDAARDLGYRDYFELGHSATVDDHVPFLRAGIPAIDLIDFQFGSAPGLNDYWHTEKDTLDKLSVRSLEIVGQTTLRLIAKLRGTPPAR
ncbi:MAG: M28 family peptidase [Verrucomicrobiota bacterium]